MDGPTHVRTAVWRLPDAPLRASAVSTKLVGLFAVASLAASARISLPLSASYAWTAPATFALLMLVSLGFVQQHHPFARFGPANQVTTLRALVIVEIPRHGKEQRPLLSRVRRPPPAAVVPEDAVERV